MKINPFHNVNQIYQKQTQQNKVEQNERPKQRDQIEISSEAKRMQVDAKRDPERQEKIDQLKQKINDGTYDVPSQDVAKKVAQFWSDA
ncbi:flagellar biosynthesis anti-sigma factor FlgM [Texcoconibacillus texcoconensis]|uniref:Negative regulator of flagellin synthesis n=1 Tax=Texcoconibacillus texcoconensis TaxID=1095777 RepID=A0A840QQW6_9BACI|nr:flagellar biosynthesis anti-sigma factor FlgM [Texcoconibacillus texcoconensis]MBB5173764.1 negative regulator of flagellin synthesis FlgM [Texcoconibacillus texcoconensis]